LAAELDTGEMKLDIRVGHRIQTEELVTVVRKEYS